MKKWSKAGTGVLLAVLVAGLAGCGGSGGSSAQAPQVTEANQAQFLQNADAFKGATATLKGKVFIQTSDLGGMTAFQMQVDGKNVVVDVHGQKVDVKENDFVEVTGKVQGVMEGTNAFGAKISAPVIQLSSFKKVDPLSVLSPTLKSVTVGKTVTQYGLSLTLDKIDYAKDEQRVYVTLKNGTSHKASLYSFEAKAVQGGKQINATSSEHQFEAQEVYKEIPSDLLPGLSASGVIVYRGLSPDQPCEISLSARTDDYSLDFQPFVFAVPAAQ